MKKIILLIFLTFQFCIVFADYTEPNYMLMDKAAKAYSKGDFNTTVELYQKVLATKYTSFKLFYNLGNAYYKLNQIPSAILYYEKARKIDLSNEDLLFNLNMANRKIVDKIDVMPEIFIKTWYGTLLNFLTSDKWAKLTIIFFISCLILLLFYLLSKSQTVRKVTFWLSVFMLFSSIVCVVLAKQQFSETQKVKEAIVFTPTVNIKSSPDQNSQDIFVIHEGLKVRIMDQVSDWYEIRIANGNKGWIKVSDVEII
jgi:tetratricopeptide (TPR) repeat protein